MLWRSTGRADKVLCCPAHREKAIEAKMAGMEERVAEYRVRLYDGGG